MKNSIALPRNRMVLHCVKLSIPITKKFPKQESWRTIRFSCRGKRVRLATWPRRQRRNNRTMRQSTFTLSLSWHGRFSRWTPPTKDIRLLCTIIQLSKRVDATQHIMMTIFMNGQQRDLRASVTQVRGLEITKILQRRQKRAEFHSSSTVRVHCWFLFRFFCFSESNIRGVFPRHHQLSYSEFSFRYQ